MPQLYQKDGTNPLHPWTTNAEAVAPSDFTLNLDHASLSRKGRLRAQVDKRLSCSLLDLWVSGFVPVTLRPWFLNTPMLPTFVFVYCLLSGFILSGRIYSTLSTSFGIKGSPSGSC
ncbi:hypothetical protein BD414DRAFT_480639 [Trametes punicea]|nr:hypothetical protein BD414DRAFT_480639 [Trametes punicea]